MFRRRSVNVVAQDEVVESEAARARDGQDEAQQSDGDHGLRAVVVHGVQAAGVHRQPGADHVQGHQDPDDRHGEPHDHGDAADGRPVQPGWL
jgi:hypothetical protein